MLAIKDNGFIPEGSPLEGYEASRAPGAVPFERVVDLANLASERKAENLPKLIAALDDPNEAIRWWGALGCAMLREQAAPAEAALRKRLEDPSGAVQSAAAEALAQPGPRRPGAAGARTLDYQHQRDILHACTRPTCSSGWARPAGRCCR